MNTLDRSDVSALLQLYTKRYGTQERPVVSRPAMALSCALAEDIYHANLAPWTAAGWQDVTFQMEETLAEDFAAPESDETAPQKAAFQRFLLRFRLSGLNPFAGLRGTVRRKDRIDTGKAVVMSHPTGDGRFVIAVSFMGTGRHFSDWVGNFRMDPEDGIHRGFLQLTRQFEENAEKIKLPETAKALGLEQLTFADVLQECRKRSSRFLLWLTGHSQGGAILQVWCMRRMAEGIRPRNIIGYGFASPSVLQAGVVADPSAYPIYHIINSDDVVPHIGSEVHLGVLLTYKATADMRKACYSFPSAATEADQQLILNLLADMNTTRACMTATAGAFVGYQRLSPDDYITALRKHPTAMLRLRKVTEFADGTLENLLGSMIKYIGEVYVHTFGEPMPPEALQAWADRAEQLLRRFGPYRFLSILSAAALSAHSISADTGAYPWIVAHAEDQLQYACWSEGAAPRLEPLEARICIEPVHNRHLERRTRRMSRDNTYHRRSAAESRQA